MGDDDYDVWAEDDLYRLTARYTLDDDDREMIDDRPRMRIERAEITDDGKHLELTVIFAHDADYKPHQVVRDKPRTIN